MPRERDELRFLSGGGEAGEIVARFDWSSTALGDIASWPEVVRTTVGIVLRSPVPIVTLWGRDGIMIYNDAYSVFAGGRHPDLFGSKVLDGWPEVAEFNSNVMKVVLAGDTLSYQDQELTLYRNEVPEQVWMNLDYSPILDETGAPCGVIAIVVETTSKIRAEARLQSERESLRQMFEQAPGLIALLVGPDHSFALANQTYRDLVGGRELIGRTVREALPEVAGQGFIERLDRVFATGDAYVGRGVKLALTPSPGAAPEDHYADFVYQPVVGDDGLVAGIFVQGHDVTEQKRAEIALRESEERFRLVADSAPVMLWMSDEEGQCVYLNAAQRAFWGIESDDVATFDWSSTIHPEDREALRDPFNAALTGHTPLAVEVRLQRTDGAYRMIETTARPRLGAGGEFLGMIGVNVDVTETRRVEAALRRETRVLGILNRIAADLAAELDLDRVVQTVTDAGTSLIGAQFGAFFYNRLGEDGQSYSLYALSGVPRDTFSKLPMPRVTALFQPTFDGDSIIRSDDILLDPRYGINEPQQGLPEGHLPVRSYLAVPVVSRSGEVIGGLFFGHEEPGVFQQEHETLLTGVAGQAAIAIDNARLFQAAERELAERRRAEEALQALNATLEHRVTAEVAERSKAEDALRQAQKMEAIGKLTGGVAHDFNNLLQVVSGNLQLLTKDVVGNARAGRRIDNALAGVARGSKLASQLLAFSRRQALEPKVVNIGRLVSGMADMLRRTIGEGVEIDTMVSGGLWNTFIDPSQLENALLNLAINARDAMRGSGKLTIEVGNAFLDDAYVVGHADVVPGQYVMLAVTDTGSGMTDEVLSQAFEPFFSTKPQGKGTGLGLSMVYGFVKQSGGHVKIYSELDQGTTVKLYLPRARQGEDVVTDTAAGPVSGGSEMVLVAEDDEEVRGTVVEMLTELGYRVLTARDAASALSVIESGMPIDLLFTDVVMPGTMKSTELARKARERLPEIAVLFTSGYTENSIVHGGRLDSGVELLSKPYSQEALARKVRHVLANRAQKVAALRPPASPPPTPVAEEPPPPSASAVTVLLCEDDALIRMSTADTLQDMGLTVVEAGTGGEALTLFSEEGVDVVITDVGLPDMSGVDLAGKLRELAPGMPIIFATGDDHLPEGRDLERTVLVAKPYDAEQLRSSIERLMAERPAGS